MANSAARARKKRNAVNTIGLASANACFTTTKEPPQMTHTPAIAASAVCCMLSFGSTAAVAATAAAREPGAAPSRTPAPPCAPSAVAAPASPGAGIVRRRRQRCGGGGGGNGGGGSTQAQAHLPPGARAAAWCARVPAASTAATQADAPCAAPHCGRSVGALWTTPRARRRSHNSNRLKGPHMHFSRERATRVLALVCAGAPRWHHTTARVL
jgi:hypothetical protein